MKTPLESIKESVSISNRFFAIGGQTPEEIALSVISEIVKCKNERTGCTQVDKDCLLYTSRCV